MLRELSLRARRRRDPNPPPPTALPSDAQPTRPSPLLSRRSSRGPSSLPRASSLLSGRPNRKPHATSNTLPHPHLRPRSRPSKSDLIHDRDRYRDGDAGRGVGDGVVGVVRQFSKKPGVSYPLVSVDELFKWRPTGLAAKCVSKVGLSEGTVKRYVRGQFGGGVVGRGKGAVGGVQMSAPVTAAGRGTVGALKRLQPPRLMLCHDFRDGYPVWEATAGGVSGGELPPDADLWRFNHWAYVDLFVYYSRYLVTVPPVGYIEAAHRHGTLVLGALVFQGEEGGVELGKVLASFKTRARAASQLAALAKFYGFDGWVVKCETELAGGSGAASDVAAFLGDLTRATRKVLGQVSEVIWIDSVLRDGSLREQSELNQENDQFFRAAGAIFTACQWDRNAPVRSAVKAGTRRTDVFTGVDIHGRNTFGGGGFQTHLALRAIKQGGTSAAIFAPSWTVEKCPPNVDDPREIEDRFWTGPSARFGRDCVAQYFKERAVITELPFSTSFDPGWGPRHVRNGVVKDHNRYFDMSQQQVQPSFMRTCVAAGDTTAAELCMSHDEAYNGSASIKTNFAFSESRMLSGSFTILRLLAANLMFPTRLSSRITKSQEGAVQISYDYMANSHVDPVAAAGDFGLVLLMGSPPVAVFLVGENSKWNVSKEGGARRTPRRVQVLGKFINCEICVAESDRRAVGAPKGDDGSTGWMTRRFTLDGALTSGQRLAEVMVIVGGPPQQPVSVRASPLMSLSNSRVGSKAPSRLGSRYGSRVGSAAVSRSNSPPRVRRDEDVDGGYGSSQSVITEHAVRQALEGKQETADAKSGDAFGVSLLQQYRESFGQSRRSEYNLSTMEGHTRGIRGAIEPGQDSVSRILQGRLNRGSERYAGVRSSYQSRLGGSGIGGDRVSQVRRGPARESYASNFNVGGTIEFDHLQEEDLVMNGDSTSRALSRLGSRLHTPRGSRPSSHMGSLGGSLASSRSGSRVGSLHGSRTASPFGTPRSGGGGAVALGDSKLREYAVGGDSPLKLPGGFRSRKGSDLSSGMNSGASSPTRGRGALSDLKTALMQAAGEMAGDTVVYNNASALGSCVIYLGGISISTMSEKDSGSATTVQRSEIAPPPL
eukprot:GFKZ01002450.1.p1 GENE.GFKZ01002450.1~~GFKZ01002450.1.p1  ORF type:complete len:1107 (+),score=139.69 GFKZ01002450.1:184-3504(+)